MKKKQLINEIMGVPKAIDAWVNYLSSVTVLLIDDIIEAGKWQSKDIDYGGEQHPLHKSSIELPGKGFTKMVSDALYDGDIKKFLSSEEFKDFPLYNPQLTVELLILPDVIYNDQRQDAERMEAMHSYVGDIQDIKIGSIGKTKIFSKNTFTFKAIIPASYISDRTDEHQDSLFNALVPTVSHELTHSYQTYRQLLGGKQNVGFGKETILNMIPQHLKFDETPSWNYFLHLVYLSLSFEVNARVTELYYSMKRKGVQTNDEALKILLASDPWDDYKQLKAFDADKFIEEFESEIPEKDPLHDLMAMFLPNAPKQPSNNEEVMKDLIDRWDRLIQDGQREVKSLGIDIPFMEKVPQRAKENPIMFFKFFEKRFHIKAEGLRRKLAKVVGLATQENQEIEQPIKEGEDFEWTYDIDIPDSLVSLERRLIDKFPYIKIEKPEWEEDDMLLVTTTTQHREEGNYTISGIAIKMKHDHEMENSDIPSFISGPFTDHYSGGEVNDSDMWFSESDSYETLLIQLEKSLNSDGSPWVDP